MADVVLVRPDPDGPRATLDMDADDGAWADVELAPAPQPPGQQQRDIAPHPRPQPPRRRPPPARRAPQPRQQQPQPPPVDHDDLADFANPDKVDDDEEGDEEGTLGGEAPSDGGGPGGPEGEAYYEDDDPYAYGNEHEQQQQQQLVPLPPHKTLDAERADIMYRLSRASRTMSVKTFAYDADMVEMRTEMARVRAEQSVSASVAFQRQLLMTICTGLEFANRWSNALDLDLDGWSESIMLDIDKYDHIFEKLHDKHSTLSMPPELQLILMIGGSALTWHVVRSGAKAADKAKRASRRREKKRPRDRDRDDRPRPPPRREDVAPERPREPAEASYGGAFGNFGGGGGPRRMRGPGVDVASMMGGNLFGGMPQVPVPALAPPRVSSRVEAPPPRAPPSESGSESERLSDVASDLPDVPEDLAPPSDGDDDLVEIEIAPKGRPRGQGRPRARGGRASQNVVVI